MKYNIHSWHLEIILADTHKMSPYDNNVNHIRMISIKLEGFGGHISYTMHINVILVKSDIVTTHGLHWPQLLWSKSRGANIMHDTLSGFWNDLDSLQNITTYNKAAVMCNTQIQSIQLFHRMAADVHAFYFHSGKKKITHA